MVTTGNGMPWVKCFKGKSFKRHAQGWYVAQCVELCNMLEALGLIPSTTQNHTCSPLWSEHESFASSQGEHQKESRELGWKEDRHHR